MLQTYEMYMRRCLHLARLGAGFVAPNPMVGSVLVYDNKIIGEGYHQQSGQAHAEVNCIDSVTEKERELIALSTLYVSLEPCAHFGKTPPCADLILQYKIRKVVIGCRDPFEKVDGKGIEKLEKAGVEVITGVLQEECIEMNKRFFVFNLEHRPYIVLKWAQTNNRMISNGDGSPLAISNFYTNRLVHRWRGEEAGIMVGTNTTLNDNPTLNCRYWPGKNPLRLVLDMDLRLPASLHIFDQQQQTIVLNSRRSEENGMVWFYKIEKDEPLIPQILEGCFNLKIQSVLIEGGARLLQSFIDFGIWDEARIIENRTLIIENGLAAPVLKNYKVIRYENHYDDVIQFVARGN